MIQITDLVKTYNRNIAVRIPRLTIEAGEIVGVVGNNGAGKTTLFRLILDLVRADQGEVQSKGQVVSRSEAWKKYTAAYLDEGFLIGFLTPEEFFYFAGRLHGLSKAHVDDFLRSLEAFFDGKILGSGKYIRDLSKGNQFKAGIAAALLQEPELLILDEPFANLDPSSQIRLVNMLQEISPRRGMTILISSHDLNHVSKVCQRVLLMEGGQIIKDIDKNANTLQELETYFKL
jgi:ABC-2 type transport system ATP-binding protein